MNKLNIKISSVFIRVFTVMLILVSLLGMILGFGIIRSIVFLVIGFIMVRFMKIRLELLNEKSEKSSTIK
ncbi:MAG: hypothetical protein JEZ08_12685 [Clostridiales bacterium]|nr:hypothetical protein [Clostridiales bacterium]